VATTTQFGAAEVFPVDEGISFDDAASLFSDGFESGSQGSRGNAASAMFSIDDEAGDSPKTNRGAAGREGPVVAAFVDTRKLFPDTVLTPADGLTVRIDEDSVRASVFDELSFLPAIP
jgi:hypothetical protein